MASSIVENIIRLKSMLGDMEQDLGLAELSSVEKKHILDHTFTQKMSRPTFFRALKSIQEKGLLVNAPSKKVGLFIVNNI